MAGRKWNGTGCHRSRPSRHRDVPSPTRRHWDIFWGLLLPRVRTRLHRLGDSVLHWFRTDEFAPDQSSRDTPPGSPRDFDPEHRTLAGQHFLAGSPSRRRRNQRPCLLSLPQCCRPSPASSCRGNRSDSPRHSSTEKRDSVFLPRGWTRDRHPAHP